MDAKEIIARRVAQEVKPNTLVNLGEMRKSVRKSGKSRGNRGNRKSGNPEIREIVGNRGNR